MPEEMTAEQAAAGLDTADSLGIPLGPGQPPAFLRALGERDGLDRPAGVRRVAGGPHRTVLADRVFITCRVSSVHSSGRCGIPAPTSGSRLRTSGASGRCSNAGAAGDDDRRDAARRRRLVLAVAARGRHDRRIAPRGRRSRSAAVVEASESYPRTFGLIGEEHRHALHVDEIDILVAFDRRTARAARRRRAAHRGRQGDRATRRRLHPVRCDPAGGDRFDPQPDRDAAGRGRRRRLRAAQRDVHRRLHEAAPRGQDQQCAQGAVRRGERDDVRVRLDRSSTSGWTATRPSRSCRSRSSTRRRSSAPTTT